VISPDFAYGLGLGLGVAAGLYLVLWWRARRHASGHLPPIGALRSPPSPPELPNGAASYVSGGTGSPPGTSAPESVTSTPPAGIEDPPAASVPDPSAARVPPTGTGAPRRTLPAPETLRLSQRVILHVYGQGHLPPGEVAPPGLCQEGIGEALGMQQAGLAAVLRRLEAAGVLTTERGHVRGHDRRLKIYRLSGRGLEVAKELRARRRPPSGR
jgi:DNA-binding MarR family transcriptional regulator